MTINHLPIELIGAVAENLPSTSDLLAFRSVNSALHLFITPLAFEKVHIRNSVQSARNCQCILTCPPLAAQVREVIYDYRDNPQFSLHPPGLQGDAFCLTLFFFGLLTLSAETCDELETAELEEALTETFCALSDFNHLERVVLHFWPSFSAQSGAEIQEHPFWFSNRQVAVLHALHYALGLSQIRSLVLHNVILMSRVPYDFVSAVTNSPFRHFSMSVVGNAELGTWSGSKARNGSLSSLLPTSNTNLKSLVLQSLHGLYHSIDTQLGGCYYPSLETLVLENMIFDPVPSAEGVEEFIVRHKASLRRLELRGCSSYVPDIKTPVREWSTILERLRQELVSVELIVTGQSYALLDGDQGYVPHPLFSLKHA